MKRKIYMAALKAAWGEVQNLKCQHVKELYSPNF